MSDGQIKETERIRIAGPGGGRWGASSVGDEAAAFGPSARRLIGRMRPDRAKGVAVVLLALVSVALTAAGPKLLGRATDLIFGGLAGKEVLAHGTKEQAIEQLIASGNTTRAELLRSMHLTLGVDFGAVGAVLGVATGVYLVAALIGFLQGYLLNDVVQNTVRRMRADIEDKVNAMPLGYFDRQPRGELLSRVTNDIDNIGQTLQQTMSQMLTSLLTVAAVLSMMIWISWLLALVALVSVPLSMLVARVVMRRSQPLFIEQWRSTGRLNSHIEETFTGHSLVKVFGRQRDAERAFADENDALFRASFGAQFISGLIQPLMMFVGNLNYVVIAVVGGWRVAHGAMSLGDIQAFIQYSRQFTQPLTQLASMANLLQSGVASAERVFELLDAPQEEPDAAGAPAAEPRGEVRFEHVSFSYAPDRPLIEDLSLVAEPGQTVAIVGPTGAGKTTLVNLIMRFYELRSGRIRLDGVDISSMPRAALRGQIGMVLQDTWLLQGTIRENIAYGRPDASEEEILAAARAAFVDRFAHSLPEGYDTVVQEEGANLSAGERQLITIARAFLAEPELLILDEATSSVDTRTELLLQHAMRALRSGRTSFVIAHRLSTIRDADMILVMEDGAIVEQGSHEALLHAGGAYAELYESQFAAGAA